MTEEIKNIFLLFGGKFYMMEFLFWYISLFIICSTFKNIKLKHLFSFVFSTLILTELISLYLTQTFIGYRFFIHFNLRDIKLMINLYTVPIVFGLIGFIITYYLFLNSNKIIYFLLSKITPKKSTPLIAIEILFFIPLLFISFSILKGHISEDSKSLFLIFQSPKSESFDTALKKNNMSDYITPNKIQATKGKNIIIISLESFEKSFLTEDKFK